ncbi:30S ribosomal protein S5 [Candidatus Pacebacteria bacterium]|nr:30S ribosomal protein S5 [Candidatus Paceibacterota bacterium]
MSEQEKQEATTDTTATAVAEPTSEAPKKAETSTDAPVTENTPEAKAKEGARPPVDSKRPTRGRGGPSRNDKRNPRRQRRGGRRDERTRPEFDQKIVSIRRVTRVMAGGRRFSFSVSMVIGDKKGKVGVGVGKAGDTQLAIEKSIRDAKKHMITVPMNKDQHIPHDVHTKYASSEVMIMPAPGRGLVAGSSVRTVLELAGVKDVTAKLFSRTKNKLNNARATIEALKQLKQD